MNTPRSLLLRSYACRTIIVLLLSWCTGGSHVLAQNAGIPFLSSNKLIGADIVNNASVQSACPSQGEVAATIKDVISFNIREEDNAYLPDNFTASVTLNIVYGDNSTSTTPMDPVTLTVNYSKDAGVSYDTKKYVSLTGARFIKATVTTISTTPQNLSNNVNVLSLLMLKSDLEATLYFDLAPNTIATLLLPTAPCSGCDIMPDELPVSWTLPSGSLNNGSQLEWTFVPGDVTSDYLNPDGSPNYTLLFRNNSTRVDLPFGVVSYNIPLFYDGTGILYYRVRAVNNLVLGNRTDAPWSSVTSVPFTGHSPSLNWQVNTSFAEDGKRKTVMQYYDGSLRMRQMVTKDNSTNTTVTAETFYDGQGRPAIQILPTPGIDNIVSYTRELNSFNGQTPASDPAMLFDLQPISNGNSSTPPLSTNSGSAKYYSSANPEIAQDGNGNIPDAAGFPYTVTRYTPDATGRIMSQSGVGQAMTMGSGHEIKYFYGNAPQEQLDGLFGTEVGISPHYFKNMTQDANGQMSISYVDMHGRTIATSLAGDPTANLAHLDLSQYPGQGQSTLTQNLLGTGTNVVKGNSLEGLTTLLVPVGELYNFTYRLTPDALKLKDCHLASETCYDCMYDLEVAITDESGDHDPYIWKFNNVSLSAANNCTPNFLAKDASNIYPSTVSDNTITFSKQLAAGSYSVRKTLTVSDLYRQTLRDQYIASAMCKDEQGIIDSIATVLHTQTGCELPPSACQTCGVDKVEVIKAQMLADMMPMNGQYASDPNPPMASTSFNLYNIFHTNAYKSPSGGPYLDANGNPDPTGSSSSLAGMSAADFTAAFVPSWAEQLLPYHPEYNELLVAQNLRTAGAYTFIDGLNNVTTFDITGPYHNSSNTTEDLDPFFSLWPAQKTYMHNLAHVGGYYNDLSLWQIAYGSVVCSIVPNPLPNPPTSAIPYPQAVDNCYNGAPRSPTGTTWNSLSGPIKNQIWNVYKGLYTFVRDSLVNVYIKNNGQAPDQDGLVNDGYTLRFPSSMGQMTSQYHFDGFPAVAGDPPTVSLTDKAAAAHVTQCSSYIERWRNALLQCPTLAARSDVNDILNEITTRMVAVCEDGLDASNPHGSSSEPTDSSVYGDVTFEQIITSVFAEKNIPISQLCNPFVIDYPKPYGLNPQVNKEMMTVVDKCACDRFAQLKQEAGVSTFTELNTYLQNTYGDVLTQVEFDAMQQCGIIDGQPKCKDVPYQAAFVNGECPCQIVDGFAGKNGKSSTNLLNDPNTCTCYTNVCRVVDSYPLPSPQPKPAFLNCGFSGSNHCVICSQLSLITTSYKTTFSGQPCADAPIITGTDLTDAQISYNNTWAQFVNYHTGLQLSWKDYIAAAAATGCNLADPRGNLLQRQTVICDTRILSDGAPLLETESPCQKADQMAIAMGHSIYEQRKAEIGANFDALYTSKCLNTGTAENFSVQYDVKEFHYTLYYYDQAGNLVRTVPPKGVRPDFSAGFISNVEQYRGTTVIRPAHILATDYRYNSLNLVVAQYTPDAHMTKFWYDNLGRLVVSQNAKQAVDGDGKYSYTTYDNLSRIVEVGQKPQSQLMTQAISQSPSTLNSWLIGSVGTREQVTSTFYDALPIYMSTDLIAGLNLRNRVSYTTTQNLITDGEWNATYYSYDVHGNVDTVLQDYNAVSGIGETDRYKRITYDYDLISNKVNGVDYQHGLALEKETFYHRYFYDAENRIVEVKTSRDSIMWEREATYNYYKHGLLARTVLGQMQTQELRNSYTLQGWIKGVNSGGLFNYVPSSENNDGSACSPGTFPNILTINSRPVSGGPATYTARSEIIFEPGFGTGVGDEMATVIDPNAAVCVITPPGGGGIPTDPVSFPIAKDAFNYSLHYYLNDYTPISATTPVTGVLDALSSQAAPLFNGNIAAMTVNLPISSNGSSVSLPLADNGSKVYNYHYDQLNRLVAMDAFDGLNTANNTFSPVQLDHYKEQVTYDPNGNILSYDRNGNQASNEAMDRLVYSYPTGSNQLSSLTDNALDGSYTGDIKGTTSYSYDNIGNLTGDGSNALTWTVYGKIATQTGINGPMSYLYDAASKRITKTTGSGTTLYVRDALGNVLTTYLRGTSGSFVQQEIDLFGSSRLGALKSPAAPSQIALSGGKFAYVNTFTRGLKTYELANHLGNVLATITDKKIGVSSSSSSSLIDYYKPDVATVQDYYPFGMIMPGRNVTAAGAGNYRYGFNGKENDNEVKGVGDQIDYGMRVYDPRVGKFLSVDPLSRNFPQLTPYQYAGNTPIKFIDLDGAERFDPNVRPTGVTLLEKSTIPGGMFVSPHLHAGQYDLLGVVNPQGKSYWVARYTYTEGRYKGMYRDDYIVGTDGVFDFIKNSENYLWRANLLEFARTIDPEAGMGSLSQDYWHMWKRQASDPMTWMNLGVAYASTLPRVNAASALPRSLPIEEPPLPEEPSVTVYRTQGGELPNASQDRVIIGENGTVQIEGNNMLYVSLDEEHHAIYFYNKRGGAGKGAYISSFEIPQSLADDIKANAVPDAQGRANPTKPQISDPSKGNNMYGLPKAYIQKLREQAIQGSGKIKTP
ncbi:MAG: hypothetical protein JST68_20505 [Bacteroidetes bacterium]|nr:hypothetical protein [Bacteroidota bacterium]